jgi:hypothetical protein
VFYLDLPGKPALHVFLRNKRKVLLRLLAIFEVLVAPVYVYMIEMSTPSFLIDDSVSTTNLVI